MLRNDTTKSGYFDIFRYQKSELSFSTGRTFDAVTFDLGGLWKIQAVRCKVEVQGYPTSRRSSETEQSKYFSERSGKKCLTNYGPQFTHI